jgi:hypothetical protein
MKHLDIGNAFAAIFCLAGLALLSSASLIASAAETTTPKLPAKSDEAAKKGEWKSNVAATKTTRRLVPHVNMKDSAIVAATVDRLIRENLTESGVEPAPRTSDEDFLRRISFDLAGTTPSPSEVTLFVLDPDSQKRVKVIDRLLGGSEYAHNWAEYWRDVIYLRATEARARAHEGVFETWMADQIRENAGWDKITTALLTARGEVNEHGETGLIYAQGGQAAEIAAETSRIFLGIQIQCANCHDHPSDKWKRQQFHQLAAFFPRVSVRRHPGGDVRSFEVASYDAMAGAGNGKGKGKGGAGFREHPERLFHRFDRNHDGKLTKPEVQNTNFAKTFDKLLANADANKDGALTLTEIKKMPAPANQRRPTSEYHMPNLKDPSSQGTLIQPTFFLGGKRPSSGLPDEARRLALAHYITAPSNPWFARAYVNRMWAEMLGEGFYTPIDDMGPQRQARMPEVIEFLGDAFIANKYDMKWLFRTIALTETYQREIRAKDASVETPPVFAASAPKRLRADQLFNAITKVLGVEGAEPKESDAGSKGKRPPRSPRAQFAFLFGYDPSTTQDDLVGNVPQALFMMNSPFINNLIHGTGKTRLSEILKENKDDKDAIKEVYILTLAREPSDKEEKICVNYVKEVGSRREGFEDVMWSLMNSSEFLSKR